MTEVNQLQERVKSLQTGFLKNQKDAQEVKAEAETMTEEVKRAEKRAKEMQVCKMLNVPSILFYNYQKE